MPALPLSEAIQHAHDAISGGNYRSAVDTCRRVLDQYPDFAAAHQLLGEAALEQRDVAEAERAFQEVLRRDPQNLAAYLGLGLIAEEHADPQRSLAYFQAAWEIHPQRTDLRDHVVRLSQRIYGVDGRLQLTRAALASLHYLSGRWSRAVAECAAVLAEHPTRVDVRLRLAEALWRRGEDTRAVAVCRQVLEQAPRAIGALLIMGAVEHGRGNEADAATLRDRARAVDPLGTRATEVIGAVVPDDLSFFLSAEAPVLEEHAPAPAEPELRRIAPAPDFSAPLPEEQVATEAPAAGVEAAPSLSLATDAELAAARPAAGTPGEYAEVLRALEDTGLKPFQAPDFASGPASVEEADTGTTAPAAEGQDLSEMMQMPSDAELEAARPPEGEIHGYTGLLRSIEDTGLEPFSVEGEGSAAAEAPSPAQGSEPLAAAAAPVAETPSAEGPETLAAALSAAAEVPAEPVAAEPVTAEAALGVAVDWDAIDDEIRRAIPGEMPHGYTEQLRSIDASGVEPFSFEGEDIPFFQRTRSAKPAGVEESAAEQTTAEAVPEEPVLAAFEGEDEVLDLGSLERLDEEPAEPVAAAAAPAEADLVALEPAAAEAPASAGALAPAEDIEIVAPAVGAIEEPVSQAEMVAEDVLVEPAPSAEDALVEPEPSAQDVLVEPEPSAEDVLVEPAPVETLVEELAASSPVDQAEVDAASVQMALDRLGVGTELFERARAAKGVLADTGRIDGRRPMPGTEPASVPVIVEELEAAAAPRLDDADARLTLAQTLLTSGQMGAALEEFRWIYHNKPEYGERLIGGLTKIAGSGDESAMAHRLLGAIYRRRGDVQLATRHYALSLGRERQLAGRR